MVDILVLGATGYTGKLITRYLAVHRERDSFTLGLAARSKSKLSQLVSELDIPSVKTFIVDVTDEAALNTLLQSSKARVVLSTVGPYPIWGRPVVRACAKLGIHYVDIAGETPFVRDVILELDFLATKTHAILVPSCGFDSLPSDVLAFLSVRTLRDALPSMSGNVGVVDSHTMFTGKGGVSGGTLASAFSLMDSLPRSELARTQAPDTLSPIKSKTQHTPQLVFTFPGGRPSGFGYLFPLSPHNVATVQRTRGLLQLQAAKHNGAIEDGDEAPLVYADNYTYSESLAASSRLSAFIFGLSIALSSACIIFFPSLRWLLKKFLPVPGKGPSDKALEKGFLKGRNISVSTPIPGSKKPITVESTLRGRGDPGYALTAVMVSETALALLAPREKLSTLARTGGVLTPMSALGTTLIRRLSASGRFEFESHVFEEGDK